MIRSLAVCLMLLAPAAQAQSWGNLDGLLTQSLGRPISSAFWLPDNADPAQANEALGIVYSPVTGAASTMTIHIGLFVRTAQGFALSGVVTELFGQSPRDTLFLPDRIELTTTMPNPGDARCCPTGTARWSIPRAGLRAIRLQ